MNKLYFLIVLFISVISCDGRYRAHLSNEANLREANLLDSFSEELKFIPEKPIEIVTDTLLNNGFNIKINYYSVESSQHSNTKKNKNGFITKTYYKNFEAQFQVYKNNAFIQNGTINKAFLMAEENEGNPLWSRAIMQYVWVDDDAMTEHSIQLNTSLNITETNEFKDFSITIFDTGEMEIKEITLDRNKA